MHKHDKTITFWKLTKRPFFIHSLPRPESQYVCMHIALRRFLHNHGNIATEESPKPGLSLLLFRMTTRVLHSVQYHRQHCTLHAFEQFGALYMHSHDDKYPGFEPGTPRLQTPVDTNEPSGLAPSLKDDIS